MLSNNYTLKHARILGYKGNVSLENGESYYWLKRFVVCNIGVIIRV